MKRKKTMTALGLALAAAVTTGAVLRGGETTVTSCGPVLGTEVCTWLVTDGEVPLELGADIPLSLIEAVPADAEMVWPPEQLAAIDLPISARAVLGIDHLALNWEAHGHPPMTFLAPHFDFHFYTLTPEEVGAIDCSDETKPAAVPAGFVLPDLEIPGLGTLVGLCVPGMGMHAMVDADASAHETFDASMTVGYYGGEPIFFEPMVARDRLLKRSDFSLTIPEVEGLPTGVRYPRELHATYDAATDSYRMSFTGFGDR